MDHLSELLMTRSRLDASVYIEKRREMVSRWTVFVSMRPEVIASFGRRLVQSADYQHMFAALNTLRERRQH